RVMVAGGRWPIDDAASAMVVQVLEIQGAEAGRMNHTQLNQAKLAKVDLEGVDTVVLSYLHPSSLNHARYAVQRVKRAKSGIRVGLFMPSQPEDMDGAAIAKRVNADFVAATIYQVASEALAEKATARPALKRKRPRVAVRPKSPAKAGAKAPAQSAKA
ncbi:AI-2E family transporter, partial [Salmonella enterica subsp. enterica serovar Enteritidis]|nr:AI-2E family transporter [Salmonella enterica subsp. enterica serovar Enteritidis]